MKFFVFLALVLLCVFSVCFRCALMNPHFTIYYGVKDVYDFFRYKKWNVAKCGELVAYVGLFGKGKTLSCVHTVCTRYRRYNNKKVFDVFRKRWVIQRVVVLSNVDLKIPYIKFTNLNQIVELSHQLDQEDKDEGYITYLYVLGDEFSVQLNSRNFKTNINAHVLNSILTCRHYHMSIFYTAQRFNHVDALLRQVTQIVISCNKLWRFQRQNFYDAYELENCTNPLNVKPIRKWCWFVRNRDYDAYDTLACVDNLSKDALNGDMLSDLEILQLQDPQQIDSVVNYTKKAKKRNKVSFFK